MASKDLRCTDSARRLPINLRHKLRREERIARGGVGRHRQKHQRKRHNDRLKRSPDFVAAELKALITRTHETLKEIFESEPLLSDLPYDITIDEVRGEIALAKGCATIIYLQRDGLSTLRILLPQKEPTIANLKRAIEMKTRAQLKRDLRAAKAGGEQTATQHSQEGCGGRSRSNRHRDSGRSSGRGRGRGNVSHLKIERQIRQQTTTPGQVSSGGGGVQKGDASLEASAALSTCRATSAGELVCSVAHNGHLHRPSVSWRFLWRAYALYDTVARRPIDDRGERGRLKLSEISIRSGHTLKFCSRVMYFGRTRQ